MDIDGMGEVLVDQVVDKLGVRSPDDLFRLEVDALASLERMGKKSAERVKAGLDAAKRRGLARVLNGLAIRHVGETMAEDLAAYFKTAVRLRDGQPMPTVEPGFTTDYRFVWAVPAAALADEPQISIRMPAMSSFISTFRIAEDFSGDASEYGDLPLAPQVYR